LFAPLIFAPRLAAEKARLEIIEISRFELPKLSAACDIASHPNLRDHVAPQQQGHTRR